MVRAELDSGGKAARAGSMKHAKTIVLIAILAPLLGNTLAICMWLPLLDIPPGTAIRPMLQSLQLGVVALVTWILGVPAGIHLKENGHPLGGILGVLASLSPFVLGSWASDWIASCQGLIWAP